jgi:hypothetical protein
MTKQEYENLTEDQILLHKRYGIVKVIANTVLGVVVCPETEPGKRILLMDSKDMPGAGDKLVVVDPDRIDFLTAESVGKFNP